MCVGEWEHPVMKNQEALDLVQVSYVKMVLMIFKIHLFMCGINLCHKDLVQDPWI